MQSNLKQKTIKGLFWKYAERVSAQLVSTIVAIILARILEPSHYGVIAIVNVFISICNVFVDTGLGESLVQKKDADDLDFSSIFYVNVFFAVFLYLCIFISAPYISKFYGKEYRELTSILRVMGLRLIFASVNSIQNAKISREMAFRKYFWVTLYGTVLSSFVGIFMAYHGFGAWALVAQYMTNSFVDTIMLLIFVRWMPKRVFSLQRVKPLFQYGWRILFSALISTLYNELRNLLIGKKYSAADLAFYSKGDTYPKLVVKNLNTAIASVLFPVFSKVQDDKSAVRNILSKSVKTSSYILFPAMLGLALVAKPFVTLLLTDKWLPCVPYLQMICFVYAIMPLSQENLQCMVSLGGSLRYLQTSILKKTVGILTLVFVFQISIFWVTLSQIFLTFFEYVVDSSIAGKEIEYGFWLQIQDIMPNIINTAIMGIVIFFIGSILSGGSCWVQLFMQVSCGIVVYLLLSIITHNESFIYIMNTCKNVVLKMI